jgi:hypothetical protein
MAKHRRGFRCAGKYLLIETAEVDIPSAVWKLPQRLVDAGTLLRTDPPFKSASKIKRSDMSNCPKE